MPSRTLALVFVVCLTGACDAPSDAPGVEKIASAATSAPVDRVAAEPGTRAESPPRGRPLPAFSGWTLDGEKIDISDLIGKRLLIYFFNPDVKQAIPIVRALNGIAPLRTPHNFEIVGIATGAERTDAVAFTRREQTAFPVIDDSSARLAQRFRLKSPIAMLGTDTEGFLTFGMAGFSTDDRRAIETNLRTALRLPKLDATGSTHPQAPSFTAPVLDAAAPFDLAAHRGEPLVLIFFLHTCPHCHASLRFLKEALASLPKDNRPRLVGVEISGKTHAVRQDLRERELDFFPVLFDEGGGIQTAYGVFGSVPDTFLIDREGRIAGRVQGWSPERHEPLLRMQLAKLGGAEIPLLLRTNGYSGNEVCGVCHEDEHETWTFTTHASAFDTLVKHGAENDTECVRCHVVGHGQPGGFESALETPELEDVGCESCHGRGGPHLSEEFSEMVDYSAICESCHDTKHSLGFDYARFTPRISHEENAPLIALAPEQKRKLLAERGRPGGSLLPTTADYVGSEPCKSCHEAEFQTWASSPHASAVETLAAKGKASDSSCLPCHTTAFDRPGGFSNGDSVDRDPDLARVGCESCHGPGGEHVKEGAVRIGNILSLGDKCDSCVILQICGSCHDETNDPGFEFEVQERIEKQRHGTIEPGTGRPKGTTAWRRPGHASVLARAVVAGAAGLLDEGKTEWTRR